MATTENGSSVRVKSWQLNDGDRLSSDCTHDFYKLSALIPEAVGNSKVPYDISRRNRILAWAIDSSLYIVTLNRTFCGEANPAKIEVPKGNVAAVTFLSGSLVSLIYQDGRVVVWGYDKKARRKAGSRVDSSWEVQFIDPRMILSWHETGDLGVFRFSTEDEVNIKFHKVKSPGWSATTISPTGRIVAGTKSGRVVEVTSEGEVPLDSIENKGSGVRALKFFNQETVFAAGDFDGLYFSIGKAPFKKLFSSSPIHQIHVSGEYISFATTDTVEMARLEKSNLLWKDRVFIFSTIVALISLGFDITGRLRESRRRT